MRVTSRQQAQVPLSTECSASGDVKASRKLVGQSLAGRAHWTRRCWPLVGLRDHVLSECVHRVFGK
jgi:hypothetical protein